MNFLILNGNRYSFTDKDTGSMIEGVNLHVVNVDEDPGTNPEFRGPNVMKVGANMDIWRDLTAVPGIYQCSVTMKPGKEKQATVKVVGVKLVKAVELAGAVKGA